LGLLIIQLKLVPQRKEKKEKRGTSIYPITLPLGRGETKRGGGPSPPMWTKDPAARGKKKGRVFSQYSGGKKGTKNTPRLTPKYEAGEAKTHLP